MLEEELDYFIENQDQLLARYPGKVLVIVGKAVRGAFATPLEAYLDAVKKFAPGTFAIQPCRPGTDAYTVTLNAG